MVNQLFSHSSASKVLRYHRDNQKQGQTIQWPTEKGQNNKQWSTKLYRK